ncbi:secreted RxLR effector protein 161-like [Cicer arietinum]|uniref:secreted RxLR effector protein 161-like n=1 Tax=Cicer arietinum TaxID=3827 RepID=UPI003CC66868
MNVETSTRPNISFVVVVLGRCQRNYGIDNWKDANNVLSYLQRTKEYMIMYIRTNQLDVIGYTYSDFGGCIDTRKSTFGYIFLLGERAISWKRVKQYVFASSTMEAEFVACNEATIQALWLRKFVSGLKSS